MSITLYTPATGFPDLEIKIAYGLARVGIETFGMEKVEIYDEGGFYRINLDVDADNSNFDRLNKSFNFLCQRLLTSPYIPFNTPGISGKSAESITINENETFLLDCYKTFASVAENKQTENVCRHKNSSIGNVIGFTVATSFHNKRDGVDIVLQYKNPKDKNSPKFPRRPTNPKKICKTCGLIALLGTWYASFIFNIVDREVIVLPFPKRKISGNKLQEIFALQHHIRKEWLKQELPQVVIPLVFLSKIPSSADILKDFDLFFAILSRQQGYHVDGLFLIPIENYLNFIGATPYNIATVDIMLRQSAYTSLQELNDVILNRNRFSLLKFARLYVQETSPKKGKWVSLLYPETTRYLLKEVAMIKEEIIKNKAVRSIAKTLGYFVWNRDYQNYSFVDGLRNAKTSKDVRQIFEKLLREAKLRYDQERT